jgi:anti-sigma factor RsiW
MDHTEAVKEMATERYLLNELTPEVRDAFEEHMFDCQECATDVRAGALFLDEAKAQLPQITEPAARKAPERERVTHKKPWWTFWTMPSFAAPAFAALLGVIAYQNLALIPGLRTAAAEPRLVPWASIHAGTRGGAPTPVPAERGQGAVVLIDLPAQPSYASYAYDLYDPQGKQFWSHTTSATTQNDGGSETLSLVIPGSGLKEGSYTLNLYGISPQGVRTSIGRRVLDVHFRD